MGEAATVVNEAPAIETRDGQQSDHAFLFATALRQIKSSTAFARRISNTVFFPLHHQVIERILARGGELVIAHPAGDPGTILGYLLFERMPAGAKVAGVAVPGIVVHFLYTKRLFRGNGVARALLASRDIRLGSCAFTMLTGPDGEALWRKHPTAEYWPYLMA